ncbi:M15 family peptidase [Actinomadura sp. GC306]|uniref:M15 family metallopeptidase n=1 Tax=Actinomadura sp. GC306 TaxID=2530367 RepID=UPI00104D3E4E|nr:M15 family metallopeptidase [Actinomadura sp. GC306]TDC59561.1 M15 family peptidase [Actinomadura sp. GC306]
MPGSRPIRSAAAVAALIAATSAAAACGGGDTEEPTSSATPPTATAPTGAPSAAPSPEPAEQGFQAEVKKVTREDLPHSWRQGCPVPPSGLRMIEMTYWGMDDKPHTGGRLVVNAKAADDLVGVFRKLYDAKYPIERMEPVDKYKGDDFDSIDANNTSAFNCRRATGSSSFSQHAYGLAIDINPCQNPYVYADGRIAHPQCAKYKNRDRKAPGMIHAGDKVVRAFDSIGWGWGGEWTGAKDYQHFSSTGR